MILILKIDQSGETPGRNPMVIFTAATQEESSLASQNTRPLKPAPEPIPGCRIMSSRFTPQSTGQSRALGYPENYTTFLRELPGDTLLRTSLSRIPRLILSLEVFYLQ